VPTPPQRTIGEILLAHGYVTEEQLDRAVERQRETGFPLGQILVEAGAITRLELASALAVQWSDLPISAGPERGDRRTVVPLTSTDVSREPAPPEPPRWQEELTGTIRALGTRLEQVESAVEHADLAGNVERLDALGASVHELRERLAEAGHGAGDAVDSHALEARLGPLASAVDESTSHAQALEGRVEGLAFRLGEISGSLERVAGELTRRSDGFAEELTGLVGRIDGRAELATVEELRAELRALQEQPAGDPTLAPRLDELAARLAQVDELRRSLGELAARSASEPAESASVDELAHKIAELPTEDQVEELRQTVAALSERPAADPTLAARVDELTRKIEGVPEAEQLEELRQIVAAVSERPSSDPVLAARVDDLARTIEALPDAEQLEELRQAVAAVSERPSFDPKLATQVDELGERLASSLADAGRLNELARRVASLPDWPALDEVRRVVDELARRPDPSPALTERIRQVEEALEERVARDDGLAARLDELAVRMEALAAPPEDDGALERHVDALASRVAELADAQEKYESSEPRLPDEIRHNLARIDELAERLVSLEHEARSAPDAAALSADLTAALEARIVDVAGGADGLADELATAVESWRQEKSALDARLAELAGRIEQATAAAAGDREAAVAPATTTPTVEGVSDQDLNRLWFAVERISLQLTEHHRDIEGLLGASGNDSKLEELQARLDDLEDRAAGTPLPAGDSAPEAAAGEAGAGPGTRALQRKVDELQKAARDDREKILAQIEQMIGSLEWRLQRLESGTAAVKPLGSGP
jgi:chromosome segregation ATPase